MLRHWEGETEEGRDGETEKGREGRRKGGGYPHTIRHSYITYSKDMSWGRGEEGGGVEAGRKRKRTRRRRRRPERERGREKGERGLAKAGCTLPPLSSLLLSPPTIGRPSVLYKKEMKKREKHNDSYDL